MYALNDIRELHLELTERCNAGCPMCGRNQDGGKENLNLASRELTLLKVQHYFNKGFVCNLERIRMCGNFGDPAVADEAIEICEFFRSINPALSLSFHTNGGVREEDWWHRLGRLFRAHGDELVFALDGLEDTLHLYRRGVKFDRAFTNACAAIRAGARVNWVMLVFEHNEHQIAEARERARKFGFASFRLKATKRFMRGGDDIVIPSWDVKSRKGEELYAIRPPRNSRYGNSVLLQKLSGDQSECVEISCHVVNRKSLYVSAEGLVFPCCWTAASIYPADKKGPHGEIAEMLEEVGGISSLSLNNFSLHEIVEGAFFQKTLPSLWSSGQPEVCSKTCNQHRNAFRAQFIEREDFSV